MEFEYPFLPNNYSGFSPWTPHSDSNSSSGSSAGGMESSSNGDDYFQSSAWKLIDEEHAPQQHRCADTAIGAMPEVVNGGATAVITSTNIATTTVANAKKRCCISLLEHTQNSNEEIVAVRSAKNSKVDDTDQNGSERHGKSNLHVNGTKMPPWHVEDITDLSGDIDNTLHLNSVDLASNAYCSDAILSITGLTVFKQEAPSPTGSNDVGSLNHACVASNHLSSVNQNDMQSNPHNNRSLEDSAISNQNMINNTISQLLNQSNYTSLHNAIDANMVSSPTSEGYTITSSGNLYNYTTEDCRFQYVLAAATSIATKLNEDTLTYLNQGQSYEIKLKKLGDLSMYRGKMLKSVIRICFHERRLQYMEREQMTSWQNARPGDRIVEVDVPLSYGATDIVQPSHALNMVHFNWDPTKEVGIYIKVNCISTEFTPKKHGGEKGVPFRIQVETYQNGDTIEPQYRLHAAACQIKVFKLKGADRKHKQDREKIMKRPIAEQEKYQPSYECTVLNDIANDAVLLSPPITPITHSPVECDTSTKPMPKSSPSSPAHDYSYGRRTREVDLSPTSPAASCSVVTAARHDITAPLLTMRGSPTKKPAIRSNISSSTLNEPTGQDISIQSTPPDVSHWLASNRFDSYVQTFANFNGADMLRMTKSDLLQICGQADGVRLYNAIHMRPITPKLKIYVRIRSPLDLAALDSRSTADTSYTPIFLSSYNAAELVTKLAELCSLQCEAVGQLYVEGPHGIRIRVNNDLISHMKDETLYELHTCTTQHPGYFKFILKS